MDEGSGLALRFLSIPQNKFSAFWERELTPKHIVSVLLSFKVKGAEVLQKLYFETGYVFWPIVFLHSHSFSFIVHVHKALWEHITLSSTIVCPFNPCECESYYFLICKFNRESLVLYGTLFSLGVVLNTWCQCTWLFTYVGIWIFVGRVFKGRTGSEARQTPQLSTHRTIQLEGPSGEGFFLLFFFTFVRAVFEEYNNVSSELYFCKNIVHVPKSGILCEWEFSFQLKMY